MELCEYVMNIAEEEAEKILHEQMVSLVCEIADEIIETAEESNPNE